MRQFYFDFASVYGTCWLVVMTVALVTNSHVNAGPFGMYGFPFLGLVYAGWAASRRSTGRSEVAHEIQKLRREVTHLRRDLHAGEAPSNTTQLPTGAPSGAGG
ncbi:MAG: hypothetical protein ACK58T_42805 [Phycisphaerae bacterium]|jgi:hypothetical protein